jgi:hypothetical protein
VLLSRGHAFVDVRATLYTDDITTDVGHVQRQAHFRISDDVGQLVLTGSCVDQDSTVGQVRKPDGNAVRSTAGIDRGEPRYQVGFSRAETWACRMWSMLRPLSRSLVCMTER